MERRPLLRSIALTGTIGALGVAWGLVTGSQMIMLDGAYSLIGLVVSWLLLLASALAGSEPGGRFPFGRESVTPLVIGVQGFVLLATLAYAAVQSVSTILEGGSEVTAGPAIVYSTITSLVSLGFWWWLRSISGDSDLLAAETTGWRVGAFRGLAMVVGFVTMGLLARSSWSDAAPYVDPVMVLLTCVLFLHTPIVMVRSTIIELLEGEPHGDIRFAVLASVDTVRGQYGFGHADVRMTKLGPKLYVEVEILVEPDVTVAVQHHIREDLRTLLDTLPFDLWMNVELLPRRSAAS